MFGYWADSYWTDDNEIRWFDTKQKMIENLQEFYQKDIDYGIITFKEWLDFEQVRFVIEYTYDEIENYF